MKCAACGAGKLRSTQRALVLTGPGRIRPGRVCRGCAAGGWLLVLGDPEGGPDRARARARRKRESVELAEGVFAALTDRVGARMARVAATALDDMPEAERCESVSPSGTRCARLAGHEGRHEVEHEQTSKGRMVVERWRS